MEQPLAVNAENSRAKVQNVGGDSSARRRAEASSSSYRCQSRWRSGVLELIRMKRVIGANGFVPIERLALHHEVFRCFASCKLSVLKELVGASGFEPPSSWSRTSG